MKGGDGGMTQLEILISIQLLIRRILEETPVIISIVPIREGIQDRGRRELRAHCWRKSRFEENLNPDKE